MTLKNQVNIYCFSLFEAGYSSVHSLIRELFNSPQNICPSLSQGDLLYVLSTLPPAKPLHHSTQKMSLINEDDKTVALETHVSFCNRHKKNIIPENKRGQKNIYPQINQDKALEKFCFMTGLKGDQVSCQFLGPRREDKKDIYFTIHNIFSIEGKFHILDHHKFNQALSKGVGSRKSYGYGLILMK